MIKKQCLFSLIATVAVVHTGAFADDLRLDMNDVSWLWPAPQTADDLSRVIAIDSLHSADGGQVWSDDHFADLITTVESDASKINDSQIGIRNSFRKKSTWKIAAIRIDPTAPGGHARISNAFGSSPQIRLILHPVGKNGSELIVHDVAVHLVYEYTVDNEADSLRKPDHEAFKRILKDIRAVKILSEDADASTRNLPLGVHPGLQANIDGLLPLIRSFLQRHLKAEKLSAIAIMGLDGTNPEPWIFLALSRSRQRPGHFEPVPFLRAQMIDFRTMSVVPAPVVNNRSPIDARVVVPADERRGAATAVLFDRHVELDDFAVIGTDQKGEVLDSELRNRDIPDLIANPTTSHFFNTDCVSCHTETRRRIRLQLSSGEFAFRRDGEVPPVSDSVLPKDDWNVRNFGWFPPHHFIGGGPTVATATQRTANETAEVLDFISEKYSQD